MMEQRKTGRVLVGRTVESYPVFPSYQAFLADSGKIYLAGFLQDIGRGGLGLSMKMHLLAGSVLKFRFQSSGNRQVEVFGKIVWSKLNRAGAKFLSPNQEPLKSNEVELFEPQRP